MSAVNYMLYSGKQEQVSDVLCVATLMIMCSVYFIHPHRTLPDYWFNIYSFHEHVSSCLLKMFGKSCGNQTVTSDKHMMYSSTISNMMVFEAMIGTCQ